MARLQRNREHDAARRTAAPWRSWYSTARWRKLRQAQLHTSPFCEACKGRGELVVASVCDHVTPHRGDADLFWWGPFQSLCKRCHDRDKQRQEAREHDRDGS